MAGCLPFASAGLLLLCAVGYLLLSRLGLGTPFSSPIYEALPPLLDSSSLTVVAKLDTPPGNLAVSPSGRVFFNFHPEYNPTVKIAELLDGDVSSPSSSWKAYPNVEFQSSITTVLSMRLDSLHDRLWLLDFGLHGFKSTPKLVSLSIISNTVYSTYIFPSDVASMGSMLNDFSISKNGQLLYIADTSILAMTPAIIVYSVEGNFSYRLLSSFSSLYGQSSFFDVNHHNIGFGPLGMKINVDSIALSRDNRALYFAPLTGSELLCVDTALVHAAMCTPDNNDCSQHQRALANGVQVVLENKPITDGITTDEDGNVWLTALGHSSIGVAVPSLSSSSSTCSQSSLDEQCALNDSSDAVPVCRRLEMKNVIQNTDLLRWADGFSFGPDGLYVTNSALFMKFNNLHLPSEAPYHIVKLDGESLLQAKCKASSGSFDCGRDRADGSSVQFQKSYLDVLQSLSGQ